MYWYRVDGWAVASATVAGQGALFVVLARWAVPPPARAHTRLCLRMPAPSETEAMAELREVIRHGTASSISIRPAGEGDLLRVEVRDDGRGQRSERAAAQGRRAGRTGDRGRPGGRPHGDRGGAAVRIVIAEDNVLLSEGLKLLLGTRGHEVAAVVVDAEGFAAAVREHSPDLAIVDVRLPPGFRDEGIHAAIAARSEHPGPPVLVLS